MYGTNIYFYLNPTNIPVTLYISVQKYIILYIHNRDIQSEPVNNKLGL